jgi:hypothetical protein
MPRQRAIPLDDVLLNATEASTICKVSRSRWDTYAKRYPALIRGCRIVQVNPTGKGVARWLKSAVVEHIHRELPRDRESKS